MTDGLSRELPFCGLPCGQYLPACLLLGKYASQTRRLDVDGAGDREGACAFPVPLGLTAGQPGSAALLGRSGAEAEESGRSLCARRPFHIHGP